MYKTKKVAWHKHLKKMHKAHDKAHPKIVAGGQARPARPARASQTSTRSAAARR